jgi:TRAP-type uncharacterized transport system substrate-binding protein
MVVMRRDLFGAALLALANGLVIALAPANSALAQARPEAGTAAAPEAATPAPPHAATPSAEAAIKARMNQWTVGLAAGLPDGGFVRFASEMARTMDDGDNMRLIPMVTRGTTTNIADLLYLRGVDVAITYADAFDFYSKQSGLANISDRVRYALRFFIADIHIYAREEFKSLQDLKGQKIAVGTPGVAAALTGPLIFRRLGIDVQTVPVGGPVALERLRSGQVAAMVYVAAKPGELFNGVKAEPGYHFLPVPYTKEFWDYYYPSTIKAENYPALLPAGSSIDTLAVPSVLAVYNWKPGTDRADRVNRFVETLFNNLARLQEPPFHPGWKDINLGAKVPGWKRYPHVDELLERMKKDDAVGASPPTTPSATGNAQQQRRFDAFLATRPQAPASGAEREELYRSYLDWNSRHPR